MIENQVRSPMVPPIADSTSTNFAALSGQTMSASPDFCSATYYVMLKSIKCHAPYHKWSKLHMHTHYLLSSRSKCLA